MGFSEDVGNYEIVVPNSTVVVEVSDSLVVISAVVIRDSMVVVGFSGAVVCSGVVVVTSNVLVGISARIVVISSVVVRGSGIDVRPSNNVVCSDVVVNGLSNDVVADSGIVVAKCNVVIVFSDDIVLSSVVTIIDSNVRYITLFLSFLLCLMYLYKTSEISCFYIVGQNNNDAIEPYDVHFICFTSYRKC
jgi:hypothetical protein